MADFRLLEDDPQPGGVCRTDEFRMLVEALPECDRAEAWRVMERLASQGVERDHFAFSIVLMLRMMVAYSEKTVRPMAEFADALRRGGPLPPAPPPQPDASLPNALSNMSASIRALADQMRPGRRLYTVAAVCGLVGFLLGLLVDALLRSP